METATATLHELRSDRNALLTALAEVVEARQLLKEATATLGTMPRYHSPDGPSIDDLLRIVTIALKTNRDFIKAVSDRLSEDELNASDAATGQGISALRQLAAIFNVA